MAKKLKETKALAVSPTVIECEKDDNHFMGVDTVAMLKGFRGSTIVPYQVNGESMGRTIRDGACAWIDLEDREVVSGEVYVVRLPLQGAVIMRLYISGNGVVCRLDNPKFPEFTIPFSEIEETFVIGRVKWVLQPV